MVSTTVRNDGDLIHAAIKARVEAFDFPVLTFPGGVRCTDQNRKVNCDSCVIGQASATWQDAERNLRSGFLQEREEWIWGVIIGFDGAVSVEEFERDLAANPIQVQRSQTCDGDHILIRMRDSDYTMPVQQQPARGTQLQLTLVATKSPK